jgi:hypothetical protein
MTERQWLSSGVPNRMLDILNPAVNHRRFRLFAVACGRLFGTGFGDGRLHTALEVAELFADGVVALADLHATYEVVRDVPVSLRGERVAAEAVRPDPCGAVARAVAQTIAMPGGTRASSRLAADLLRDIFGNLFRPMVLAREWRTDTAVSLARVMYESRDFSAMPILADALQDAGCDNPDILDHCRDTSLTHVRGCWVTDLVLGKS